MVFIDLLSDFVERVCTFLMIIILLAMSGCLTTLIFGRNFFGIALAEVEEVSRYTLVWLTFIGGTLVYKRNEHMAFDFVIVNFLKGRIRKVVLLFKEAVVFLLILTMIYYGFEFVGRNINNTSLQLQISMAYVYMIIPFSGLAMFFHSLRHLAYMLKGKEEIISDGGKMLSE